LNFYVKTRINHVFSSGFHSLWHFSLWLNGVFRFLSKYIVGLNPQYLRLVTTIVAFFASVDLPAYPVFYHCTKWGISLPPGFMSSPSCLNYEVVTCDIYMDRGFWFVSMSVQWPLSNPSFQKRTLSAFEIQYPFFSPLSCSLIWFYGLIYMTKYLLLWVNTLSSLLIPRTIVIEDAARPDSKFRLSIWLEFT